MHLRRGSRELLMKSFFPDAHYIAMQLVAKEARERERAKQAFLFFPSSKNALPLFAIMHDASMRTGAHNAGHELYAVAACRCKRYFRLHSATRPLLRSCMRSFPLTQRLAQNETTDGAVMNPLSHGFDRFRSCVLARPAVTSDLAFFSSFFKNLAA